MATQFHVNPRFRAYGKARIDIAQRANTRDEWEKLWRPPQNAFPFEWGSYWKQCVEYRVGDYAAEVGFYIDVLGFPVNAFDSEYAQFTSPDEVFYIAVVPARDLTEVTPPDSLRLQFMIYNIEQTAKELEIRGVVFEMMPKPIQPGSQLMLASFRSPHGILIELWGEKKTANTDKIFSKPSEKHTVNMQQEEKVTLTNQEVRLNMIDTLDPNRNGTDLKENEMPSQFNKKLRIHSLEKLNVPKSKVIHTISNAPSNLKKQEENPDNSTVHKKPKNRWYSYRVVNSGSSFRRSPN